VFLYLGRAPGRHRRRCLWQQGGYHIGLSKGHVLRRNEAQGLRAVILRDRVGAKRRPMTGSSGVSSNHRRAWIP